MKEKITLFYTSDIHGNVLPKNYHDNSFTNKGLLWVKSIVDCCPNQFLLLDNGDTMQGSPLMNEWIYHNQTTPSAMNIAFNYLKYDYITLGNHDFNYGQESLHNYYAFMNAQVLCANIKNKHNEYIYPPYKIFTTNKGVRIGLIGLVTQYLPHWEKKENLEGLVILDAYSCLEELVPQVRKKADCIVVLYHGGYERDVNSGQEVGRQTGENKGYLIANNLGIDILLTGHQHLAIEPTIINKTFTMQVKDSGRQLGQVDIEFVSDESKTKIVSIGGKIIDNNDSIDKDLEVLIKPIEDKVQKDLDQVIGKCENEDMIIHDQFNDRLNQNPMYLFVPQVMKEISGADIACCSLNNNAIGFGKKITQRDIFANFIYPNSHYIIQITGKILKQALEKTVAYFYKDGDKIVPDQSFVNPKVEHYNYDVYAGIDYKIDVNKSYGNKIFSLKFKGQDIKDDDLFSLCLNNYRYTGGGDYSMLKDCPIIKNLDISAQDIFTDYIKKHKIVKVPKNTYEIIK